jgi:hypothetical protein
VNRTQETCKRSAAWRSRLAPEDRLCLLLARGTFPPATQTQALDLLDTPLRWDIVLDRASTHAIVPLVHRNLERLEFYRVPTAARERLAVLTRVNAFRNILLREDLRHTLEVLGGAGLPVIPLKGVALAASLYGDAALRVSSDLDILVPPDAVARAFDLLLADGYEPAEPYTVGRSEIDWLLASNMEYGFVRRRPELVTILELHWDIAWRWQREGRAAEQIWKGAEPRVILGSRAWALSPEWEALYLMIHAARHRWQGLKWVVDIHELCVCCAVPWDAVFELATAFGWDEAVRVSLGLCETLFDTPIPERCAGTPLPTWVRVFPSMQPPGDIWADALVPLQVLRRPDLRLRYLARVLLLPTLADRRALRLPDALYALYYLLRPLRLCGRFAWDRAGAGLRRLATFGGER